MYNLHRYGTFKVYATTIYSRKCNPIIEFEYLQFGKKRHPGC